MVRLPKWLSALRDAVLADLFPEPPSSRQTGGVLAGVVAACLVAATALIVLSLLRQTGAGALDTVWAEDGSVFLRQARETSLADVVFDAYAGYLHIVPRVLAELAAAVPITLAATALALLGAGVGAVCALTVYAATAGHLRTSSLRLLLAAMVVLQPVAALESLNTVALGQWHLGIAAFWLALWRPRSWWGTAGSAILLVLTVLSAPLAFVLAPVLVLRAAVVPTWRDRVPALAFLAGAVPQTWVLLSFPAPGQPAGGLTDLVVAYALRVVQPAVVGLRLAERASQAIGARITLLSCLVAVAVVLVALVRPRPRHPLTVLLAVATSVAAFTVSAWLRGVVPLLLPDAPVPVPPTDANFPASRFVLLSTMLLYGVLALALDGGWGGAGEKVHASLRAVAVGFVVLVAGIDFFSDNDRSRGVSWRAEITAATQACRDGAEQVELQVTPDVPSFRLPAACTTLPP